MIARTLRVLGFPAICERLAGLCASPLGREKALALLPSPTLSEVDRRQRETSEARHLAETAGGLPVRGARDIRESVHRAGIGGVLGAREVLEIRTTLATVRTLKGFIAGRRAEAPVLAELAEALGVFPTLEAAIGRAISDDGAILDDASPDLSRIRRERRVGESRLRSRLEEVIRAPAMQRMLQEALITIRDDRFVVPVRAEFRDQFPGVAHDHSASGVTVFMEPLAIVPLGNRLRELAEAEQQEIARILAALSQAVGAAADDIAHTLTILADLDVAAAKASLSLQVRGTSPGLNAVGRVALRAARHPLLSGAVVPVDISLGERFRTLIITGPNTGGKTVTLRTLGLLTLMAEAGLHIPAAAESEVAVFPQVYADIGDEQSIEQNLSTFSSHLTAIVEILHALADDPPGEAGALVLLDEVGAGTDPTEGTALARALIETFHALGACTAVTTHYNELKALAFTHLGVENASVEFDEETLRPTYRLLIGTPGRSNALAIAARLGLDAEIVDRAREYLARHAADLTHVLQKVEEERAALARDRETLARAQEDVSRTQTRLAQEAERLAAERRRIADRAQAELGAVLRRGRQDLDALMAALRAHPTPEAASRVGAHLRDLGRVAEAYTQEVQTPPSGAPPENLRAGEDVLVVSLGQRGVVEVEPDNRGEAEVQVGVLKVRVPLSDLRRVQTPGEREVRASPVSSPDLAKALSVSATLDLRGMTADDAVLELDKYLDEAVLAGLARVTVIHGKGTGALRRAVHEHLAHHPEVAGFRLGGDGEGGSGATIVELPRR
ncbi:MAG TPA: endonuclease MutS2 [bacterium]|nr:endonuclease MutS2 [bacterium]